MALLSDQLTEAREAFKNAHEAGDSEAAKALANRVFELETQQAELDKAAKETATQGSSVISPVIGAGTGAVVGAATNPLRGTIHDIITPSTKPVELPPAPNVINSSVKQSGGQDWTKSLTGVEVPNAQMNKSSLNVGQRMAETIAPGGPLAGGSIHGGVMIGPDIRTKVTPPQAPAQTSVLGNLPSTGKSYIKGLVADHQPTRPMDIVKGGARGAITGGALADVAQQIKQGNYGTAAADIGLAGGNIAHGLSRTPKGKALGTLTAIGSGLIRGGQAINELMPEEKAIGGLVHLAAGGQPEGEAYAYEPTYNERIRDKVSPYLGYKTAERLFGGPSAQTVDKYNPVAWLAQTPGNIAQAGKDFYEASKQGEYIPAMMSFLGGAMDASPMLSKAGKVSNLLKYEGGNKAFEEGMERSAPLINKGVQFVHNLKGQPKNVSVLQNYSLPAHAEGGEVQHFAPGGRALKKFTEAIIPHEGKTLVATLADRTKATEGFHGGPGFINLHPDYTWAVDAPNVVTKHMRAVERFGGPEQTVFAPMLMSSEAHKSNRDVFRQIYGDMAEKIKSGQLTPEQINALDARILAEKGVDLSKSPGVASPEFLQFADTFNRRGKVADILGLKRTGAVDLQKHLDETIDPALRGVETGAIGPQLFTIEGAIHKPDIHPSYEQLFLGQKGANQFTPVPREFLFRDLEKQAVEQMGRPMTDYNYRNVLNAQGGLPNQLIDEKLIRSLQDMGYKDGGQVAGYAPGGQILKGGLGFFKPAAKSHSQDPVVARALEEYLKGNISQAERMAILNKQMPLRPWTELPPAYSDEQIKMALMENKRPKALLPVPEGMRVGNRLDIPAYTQNGVYVDTTHNLAGSNSPISYNRTGHLTDVEFSSKPNQAVRVGLGTKEQALTPMGAEMGAAKSPFAMIKGTNVGTSDDEVRRMMSEYINDPEWAQIGMDPRRHSQFYDKSTGLPVWSAEQKLQSGPLVLAPRRGLETTSWDDPRLDLTDFPGKKYKKGGLV